MFVCVTACLVRYTLDPFSLAKVPLLLRTGEGCYEILALTESRYIIGKPLGHRRANSYIPGCNGERFTPMLHCLTLHQADGSLLNRPPWL